MLQRVKSYVFLGDSLVHHQGVQSCTKQSLKLFVISIM